MDELSLIEAAALSTWYEHQYEYRAEGVATAFGITGEALQAEADAFARVWQDITNELAAEGWEPVGQTVLPNGVMLTAYRRLSVPEGISREAWMAELQSRGHL